MIHGIYLTHQIFFKKMGAEKKGILIDALNVKKNFSKYPMHISYQSKSYIFFCEFSPCMQIKLCIKFRIFKYKGKKRVFFKFYEIYSLFASFFLHLATHKFSNYV